MISVSQDSLGKQAAPFTPPGASNGALATYWAGALSDGVVIGLVNSNSGTSSISVSFSSVPGLGSGTYYWTEFYTGNTGSGTSVTVSLGTHDMAVIKVTTTETGTSSTSKVSFSAIKFSNLI